MNTLEGIIEDVEKSDLVSDKVIKKVIKIIGQEKWQDIHNEESDICTTTGELIITLKGLSNLEKENTELKDDNKVMANNYSKMEQKFDDNLTKAKELLKKWLFFCGGTKEFKSPLQEETERFLQEQGNEV